MSFPQEITTLCIHELARDGSADLLPLLSVSRSFYYPTKELIFRHISLFVDHRRDENFKRLVDVLRGDPLILKLIRSVRFTIDSFTNSDAECRARLAKDKTVPLVLSLFEQAPITQLSIDLGCWSFPRLDDAVVQSLVSLRCKTTLRHFSLQNAGEVPLVLVAGIPALDDVGSMCLVNITSSHSRAIAGKHYDAPVLSIPPPFARLKVLELYKPQDIITFSTVHPAYAHEDEVPLPYIFPELETVIAGCPATYDSQARLSWWDAKALDQLLSNAQNITAFILNSSFNDSGYDWNESAVFRLQQLRHLHTLQVNDTSRGPIDRSVGVIVLNLYNFFFPLKALKVLEISFIVPFFTVTDLEALDHLGKKDCWMSLIAVLVEDNPPTRQLTLIFKIHAHDDMYRTIYEGADLIIGRLVKELQEEGRDLDVQYELERWVEEPHQR